MRTDCVYSKLSEEAPTLLLRGQGIERSEDTGEFLGTTQQEKEKAEGGTFGGSCLHSLACTSVNTSGPSWLHLLLLHFPSFPPIAADSRVSFPFPMPPSCFRCSAFSCLNYCKSLQPNIPSSSILSLMHLPFILRS